MFARFFFYLYQANNNLLDKWFKIVLNILLFLLQKRFEGTQVTVESFLRWKFNFEEDMGVLKKRNEDEKNKKLTGRELFMTDKSLNESDLKFLEEG